jgi:hypothetical protein
MRHTAFQNVIAFEIQKNPFIVSIGYIFDEQMAFLQKEYVYKKSKENESSK